MDDFGNPYSFVNEAELKGQTCLALVLDAASSEQSPEEYRDALQRVRETIRGVMPEATEKLSWKTPTFLHGKNLIQFAVHIPCTGIKTNARA